MVLVEKADYANLIIKVDKTTLFKVPFYVSKVSHNLISNGLDSTSTWLPLPRFAVCLNIVKAPLWIISEQRRRVDPLYRPL